MALPRSASHEATLLDLVRSERQLQFALQQQQVLLQTLNDATAALFELLQHAEISTPTGLAWGSSLHELLIRWQRSGDNNDGNADASLTNIYTEPAERRAALARIIDARLLDTAGKPPCSPLLVDSLTEASQLLLVPFLRQWMKTLADALPALCRSASREREAGALVDSGRNEEEVEGGSGARESPRSSPTKSAASAAGIASAATSKRARDRGECPPALTQALPPPFALASPPTRFRLVCQAVRRLLGYLLLLLGLTEAFVSDVISSRTVAATETAAGSPRERDGSHSRDEMAYFAAQMAVWVGIGDGAGNPRGEGRYTTTAASSATTVVGAASVATGIYMSERVRVDGAPLPLVCLARRHTALRSLLRFLLVDVQELADVLTEECLFRARQPPASRRETTDHGIPLIEPGGGAPLAGNYSNSNSTTAAMRMSAFTDESTWPSVAEVASVAHVAQVVSEALSECIHLSGDTCV